MNGHRARRRTFVIVGLLVSACGGAEPRRERVPRPCVELAWIDEGRGSLAAHYIALGGDAWLSLDLTSDHTVLYGADRLAAVGVRRADRHVLVPPLFGAMPHELEVVAETERPFVGPRGSPASIVGRLGLESLEDRTVEIDTHRMQLCDRYPDEVAQVRLRTDAAALVAPFTGRHFLVVVDHGEARVGELAAP